MSITAEHSVFGRRLTLAAVVLNVVLLLIGVRLWYLQCFKGAYFRDLSENNRTRTIRTLAPRGTIYDRDGKILVRNRPAFSIALVTEDIPDIKKTLITIAEITGRDVKELEQRFESQRKGSPFEPKVLLADVSREELARIRVNSYRLPGVTVNVVPTRLYPFEGIGAQLYGYPREIMKAQLVSLKSEGYAMGDLIGQTGLEKEWEKYLRGQNGFVRVEVDAMGNRKKELGIYESKPGNDLYLTIDLDLQQAAQQALGEHKGAVVAIDPNSGEILAMVSAPSFDANIFSGEMQPQEWRDVSQNKARPLKNRTISDTYPPGSTFKVPTTLAGLAEGKITPNTVLNCPGYYFFAGRRYHCHKRTGHGPVNLLKALTVSCNSFYFQLGEMLGVDTIHRYATMLGLGKPTGIDLLGESSGLIPSSEWKIKTYGEKWYPGETLSVAIGQGYVNVTPIQMATAFATIANDGKLFRPYVVKRIVDRQNGGEQVFNPDLLSQLSVPTKYFEQVKELLLNVVESKEGTGQRAKIEGIKVGGKTGTAQVSALGRGVSDAFQDHAWFVAFAPVDNPQIAVATIVENAGHGGVAAAPVVRQVMEKFFRKKGMIPEEVAPTEEEKDLVTAQNPNERPLSVH